MALTEPINNEGFLELTGEPKQDGSSPDGVMEGSPDATEEGAERVLE